MAASLNDLVSYNDKHNEANGEDNNDGHNDNRSNYMAQKDQPTTKASIHDTRAARNAISPLPCFSRTARRCY